jgi:pyruvate,orthophosphate dikinase
MKCVLSLDEVATAAVPDARVGRKAASLGRLIGLGMPVPPGFVVTTEVFHELESNGALSSSTRDEIRAALRELEIRTGRELGGGTNPLLVAVRSGAPVSMPGMLETVLDVGMTRGVVEAIAASTGDRRFALDCMRRFVTGFATTVLGVALSRVEAPVVARKYARATPRARDTELDATDLQIIVDDQIRLVEHEAGLALPDDPVMQLELAIAAVLRSWHLPRAIRFRRMNGLPDRLGTACTVQAMVFGNHGTDSGAGVLFSRHPSTGEPCVTGEYSPRGQGTDVVGGAQRPLPLDLRGATPGSEAETLESLLPDVYEKLVGYAGTLERAFGDALEIEFAFEQRTVYLLQARPAKRAARAAVRIAVDLFRDGIVDEAGAIDTIDSSAFAALFRRNLPSLADLAARGKDPIARGLPASPGAASGRLVFSADEAVRLSAEGEDVILVRRDTSPDDVHGVKAAVALLTTAGGLTSHAAVVARGLGRPCVAGCTAIHVYEATRMAIVRWNGVDTELAEGDQITVDGSTGAVFAGVIETEAHHEHEELGTVLEWANARRRLRVQAVVESTSRAITALKHGADGIGMLSCDSMLVDDAARFAARCLLVADPDSEEAPAHEAALERSLEAHLTPLFAALDGRLLVLRLFDDVVPMLVAVDQAEVARIANGLGESRREVERRLRALEQTRAGLGLRGVRLALTCPALTRALVRAVLGARGNLGETPSRIELAVPALATGRELGALLGPIRDLLRRPGRGELVASDLPVGAIIGLPHACLEAREIAALSEFIIFDTHELTQSVFGMSREDSRGYLSRYIHDLHIFDADPFIRFDETGVGVLIRTGATQAREVNPRIRLEIAGEVAGETAAVRLAAAYEMDAVSCPPDRMLAARIAAAQAMSAR